MKYTRFLTIAVAAMALVGCVKENTPDNNTLDDSNLVEFTITAGVEDPMAKAAFGDEYPTIEWKDTDLISVLGAKTGNQQFKANSSGVSTEFNGLLDLEDETLYAVYPYNAAIQIPATPSSNNEELVEVTIPSVQYATEESFDPSAYVAVAKSTDKNFSFKSIGSFIKFQLEDGENVKSVTIVANNSADDKSTTIATTAAVRFNSDGTPTHGLTGWKNSTNTIRLVEKDGGDQFKSGKDYFIVLRAHTLPTGIQIYVEYDNGTVYTRSTTSQIFPSGKARNTIANMGTFGKSHKFTQVNDLYSLYNMGYDIKVGNISINIANYSTATLTSLTNADTDLTAILKKGGIHFIEGDTDKSFTISGYVDVANNLIIINNNPENKIRYSHSESHYYNLNNSTFAMKGIEINLGTKYMINNSKCTDNSGKFIFDDCKIDNVAASFYYGSKANVGISLFQFCNCDIVTTGAIQFLNLNKTTVMNDYEKILFHNCTFSATSLQNFQLINSASASQLDSAPDISSILEVKNCSFHNLRPNSSYINIPWGGNIRFTKNLISIYSLTQNGTMVNVNTDTEKASSIDTSDNYYYVNNFNNKTLKTTTYETDNVKSEDAYMFNTNTFVVKPAYAGYGALR